VVVSGVVSGGDVVIVANLAPLTIALMVKPTIEKPEIGFKPDICHFRAQP
jgi:hypothetical protein